MLNSARRHCTSPRRRRRVEWSDQRRGSVRLHFRPRNWSGATASASYDIVQAVRVNCEPRHKFVLGLGTQNNSNGVGNVVGFWTTAIRRMKKNGISKDQRKYFAVACARKGARLPTKTECENYRAWYKANNAGGKWGKAEIREVIALCRSTARQRKPRKRSI